jgi:nitrogen regulatory protein P-II 1
MKKIEAIIRNEKLNFVKKALAEAGFSALTTYEVKGRGKQTGIIQVLNGTKVYADLLPKTKIDIVIPTKDTEKVISIIMENSRTGNIGDGKIFISNVENVVRVRDGERGKEIV